ncbi:DUF397 domain-containing protein [Nocardiopsis aegyptia]|uniref:DUF397 domain-containing protein n=1 Tax=Nocardiopsis aegyptia TaxID=220378 RepID=A0A7Z0ETR3_9ACTN|nr:DUF397 domain-containing protein [Nocardiopsis aegyptia]NYJ37165.1 hypothetical protein [Nocardiopsis aegyptia]
MNTWHKSTYSENGSHCVEVKETARGADVRDTQNREAGHLSFPAGEWSALLRASSVG